MNITKRDMDALILHVLDLHGPLDNAGIAQRINELTREERLNIIARYQEYTDTDED